MRAVDKGVAERIIAASPTPKSLTAEPLTVAELDAHPDSPRLWATVKAVQTVAYADGLAERKYPTPALP